MTTAEQGAVAVLEIFRSHKVSAGGVLKIGDVQLEYFRTYQTGDGFLEGAELACQRGWLEVPRPVLLKLTAAGLAEIQREK
jgi:hypothetical protein